MSVLVVTCPLKAYNFVSKSSKKVRESYQTHFLILKLADGEIGRRAGNFLPLAILQKPFLL